MTTEQLNNILSHNLKPKEQKENLKSLKWSHKNMVDGGVLFIRYKMLFVKKVGEYWIYYRDDK